jgi:adenosine deaminase
MPDAFDAAPKVELHLHLEGAIPLDTLWGLIQSHGGDPEVSDRAALERRFVFRDFAHFIDTWWWMTGFIRTEDDFTEVAESVARHLAAQNIVYAEASYSPTDFERHGLSPQALGMAIRRGLDRVPDTQVVLNVDLVRDSGPERAAATLESVLEISAEADVRGITIGGSEQDHPPEQFSGVYRRAADAGLRLTAHAGEAAGPASVWGALRELGVERIGHGVRSVEDSALVEHLVSHQIPLEVCPTSNIRTGVAQEWDDHPVHRLIAAGANVTINSDDPALFNCSLADEFRVLSRYQKRSMEDLTIAAVEASWLDDSARQVLAERVREWWGSHQSPVSRKKTTSH